VRLVGGWVEMAAGQARQHGNAAKFLQEDG